MSSTNKNNIQKQKQRVKSTPPSKKNAQPQKQKKKKNRKRGPNAPRPQTNMNVISDVRLLRNGQGVLSNIIIETTIDNNSWKFMPVGLVSMAYSRGAIIAPFAVYSAIYNDLANLFDGGVGAKVSRLAYLNDILGSIVPKTVKYRPNSTVAYTIKNNNVFSTPPTAIIPTHNGKNYFMAIIGGPIIGIWQFQTVSVVYSSADIAEHYIKAMEALAGSSPHNKLVRDAPLAPTYLKDVSAYARCSSYYGQGAGIGTPALSVENEVAFRAPILGVLQSFNPSASRSSRFLTVSSGDACSNYALGALDTFPVSYYQGCVPPIYKFLDIAELAYILINTLIHALEQKRAANIPSSLAFLYTTFPFTYTQFLIMLRQQIVWMFADSQCLGQFLTNQSASQSFQAFLCGTNVCPVQPKTTLKIDNITNENLRMLRMCVRPYGSTGVHHVTQIPVWGAMLEFATLNFAITDLNDNSIPLFLPEVPNTPDLWDGSLGGNPVDFNNTGAVNMWAQEWNTSMDGIANVLSGVSYIGGASLKSPLLQFTRYLEYHTPDFKCELNFGRAGVPRSVAPYIREETKEVAVLERKTSKRELIAVQVYAPPDNSVYDCYTMALSGLVPITPAHKQFLSGFILPIQEVRSDNPPSISEVQSFTYEPYKVEVNAQFVATAARYAELDAAIVDRVVGLAGHDSELASFVKVLNDTNQGGFLGDVFAAVGTGLNAFGFKGAGQVAGFASGVANTFGI